MKSYIILTGAMLFSSAMAGSTGPITYLGCYQATGGTIFKNSDVRNSKGRCGDTLCPQAGSFALQDWKCYCGDTKPLDSEKVDDTNCNKNCPGFPTDVCGGKGGSGFYSFYDNGNLNSLPQVGGSSSSTSSAAPTSTSTSVSVPTTTSTTSTTPTTSATPTSKPSSGPNVAGIAAGVVVGVLAILGIVGGLFFFMRNRKRRAIEEEHRRNAVINSAKPPINSAATSFNDTRLDPVLAHRRMSDGSIADNQDYSRRILKVTN